MSKTFIDIPRLEHVYRPIDERVNDCSEVEMALPSDDIRQLAKRCQNGRLRRNNDRTAYPCRAVRIGRSGAENLLRQG